MIVSFLMFAITGQVKAGGSDFVQGSLSVAAAGIYNAQDYKANLRVTQLSNVPFWSGSHTNSWLAIFLDNNVGVTFGEKFSQVGLLTNGTGLHWFVYSEANVVCLRGAPNWASRGCIGDANDLVSVGSWHTVEMVH